MLSDGFDFDCADLQVEVQENCEVFQRILKRHGHLSDMTRSSPMTATNETVLARTPRYFLLPGEAGETEGITAVEKKRQEKIAFA
jgi:hypothetical protein